MPRIMADAIHANVPAIPRDIQLVAGYVTGTPDIQWTAADWDSFAGIPHVTIDQGFQSPPVTTAVVRDVEPSAWTPAAAVNSANWQATRRTIYCNQSDLSRPGGVLASGWQGDLWIAIPNWQPGQALPAAPGCTIVAVQSNFTNPAVDLSYVLDPAWPDLLDEGDQMPIAIGATGVAEIYLLDGGKMSHIPDQASLQALTAAGVRQVTVTPACLTQFLADYPPGNPTVEVGTVNFPPFSISGTATPQ
jgi:hypothetical protein